MSITASHAAPDGGTINPPDNSAIFFRSQDVLQIENIPSLVESIKQVIPHTPQIYDDAVIYFPFALSDEECLAVIDVISQHINRFPLLDKPA